VGVVDKVFAAVIGERICHKPSLTPGTHHGTSRKETDRPFLRKDLSMSDYLYGADLTANPYLARISTSSPRKAVALLEAERRRFEEMRMWCYDILQQVAWGYQGIACKWGTSSIPRPPRRRA